MIPQTEEQTPEQLRERDALRDFIAPDSKKIAGVTLRPFMAGSLAMLREVDSIFATGKIHGCKNKEYEFLKFLYIQGHPNLDEVREIVVNYAEDPKALKRAVLKFGDGVSLSDIDERMNEVFALLEPAIAAMVKVVDEKKKGGIAKPEAATVGKS